MNAEDVLKYGHNLVLEQVDGLPTEQWYTQGVCGWWSVRDILGHLASYEQLYFEAFNHILNPKDEMPILDRRGALDGDKFNKEQVARRQNYKPREVLAEYSEWQEKLREVVGKIPVEKRREAGLFPWYGEEYDLEDIVCYSVYAHKREHGAQMAVFMDHLKA